MANYLARIELQDVKEKDYDTLSYKMGDGVNGYVNFVMGRDSRVYHLPAGTYVLENSNLNLDAAYAAALEAAKATGLKFTIFVADWNLSQFHLEQADTSII